MDRAAQSGIGLLDDAELRALTPQREPAPASAVSRLEGSRAFASSVERDLGSMNIPQLLLPTTGAAAPTAQNPEGRTSRGVECGLGSDRDTGAAAAVGPLQQRRIASATQRSVAAPREADAMERGTNDGLEITQPRRLQRQGIPVMGGIPMYAQMGGMPATAQQTLGGGKLATASASIGSSAPTLGFAAKPSTRPSQGPVLGNSRTAPLGAGAAPGRVGFAIGRKAPEAAPQGNSRMAGGRSGAAADRPATRLARPLQGSASSKAAGIPLQRGVGAIALGGSAAGARRSAAAAGAAPSQSKRGGPVSGSTASSTVPARRCVPTSAWCPLFAETAHIALFCPARLEWLPVKKGTQSCVAIVNVACVSRAIE